MLPDTLTEIKDWKHSKVNYPNPLIEALKWLFSILGICSLGLMLCNLESLISIIRSVK